MKFQKTIALAVAAASIAIAEPSIANVACALAPIQLQQYINQVNQVANLWLYQGIPQRCGLNPSCRGILFQQLDFWYQQQGALVNQWYYQIALTCTNDPHPDRHRFSPSTADDQNLDQDVTEDLHVDKNENKTVAIVIPDNPTGFNGR